MSTGSSKFIEITHVINPHLFWFKYKDTQSVDVEKVELALEKYVAKYGDKMSAVRNANDGIKSEEYVAVYMNSREKWIRAKIDVYDDPSIVWAIDYGIPLKKSLEQIVLLNDELKQLCRTTAPAAIKGGVAEIFPATHRITEDLKERIVKVKKWEQQSIELMNKISKPSITLSFNQILIIQNHAFGTLEFCHNGETRSFGKILANDLRCAFLVIDLIRFKRNLSNSDAHEIDRWCNNNGEVCVAADYALKNKDKEKTLTNQTTTLKPLVRTTRPTSSAQATATDGATADNNARPINQNKLLRAHYSKIKCDTTRKAETSKSVETPTSNPSANESSSNKIVSNKTASAASTQLTHQQPSVAKQKAPSTEVVSSSRSLNRPKTITTSPLVQNIREQNVLINNLKKIRILAHNNIEDPCDFNSANFTSAIYRGMKNLNLQENYDIQAYAWPNLMRGNSVVMIHLQRKGKTVAYLPAVCSLVERENEHKGKHHSVKKGTTVIIVCLTASVPKIASMCRDILNMQQFKSNVVEAIGKREINNITVKLFNGSNILVTTAPCLKELLSDQGISRLLKSDKLRCIVFENIDCIMDIHPDSCNEIIKELCLRKSYKGEQRQIIATSRTWQPFLEKFLNENIIADSTLLIGNHLESALWAGVTLQWILCKRADKLQNLTDQIKLLPFNEEKTLIICNQFDEAEQVAKHLESNNVPVELVKNIQTDYAKNKIKAFWTKMEGVLICDDEQLNDTTIMDAHHIFHYTIPKEKYVSFVSRLSTMLHNYNSESKLKDAGKKLTSTVIVDEDNYRQLPKFVDLLKRSGQTIPEELEKVTESARKVNINERATDRCYEPICSFVFMHGSDDHFGDCASRHVILRQDILTRGIPNQITNGTLRFHVFQIISPTEYIVRPTMLKSEEGEWNPINSSNEFISLDIKMQAFYKNEQNVKCLSQLKLGGKCVVEYKGRFYRGEILRIYPKSSPIAEEMCMVRFVDTGNIQRNVLAHDVYALDESFGTTPNQAYTLHLTSVVPADKEDDWDPTITEQVKKELNKWTGKETNTIYEANVLFVLRNTLVVDIMRLVNLSRGVVHCSLKSYLQNRNYGILSPEKCQKVIEMAKNAGVKVFNTKKAKAKKSTELSAEGFSAADASESMVNNANDQTQQNTSYDSNESTYEEECNEKWANPWKTQHKNIDITTYYGPDNFYVAQKSELTRKLYNEIDKYAKENIESAKDESLNTPDVDMPCLAKVENRFFRGKIIDVIFDVKCDLKVFLVDTGETVTVDSTNVFEIPENLVEMCAYQAIWCNLTGIKPIGNGTQWTKDESDVIYDEIDSKFGNDLYLHTINENKSVQSAANIMRYDVVLLAVQDNNQYCLNDLLVSGLQLAEHDAKTKHHLQNLPNLLDDVDSDSSDSDWEKEIDVNRKNNWPSSCAMPEREQNEKEDSDFDIENCYVNFEDDDLLELFPELRQMKSSSTPNATLQKIEEEQNETDMNLIENKGLPVAQRTEQVVNGCVSTETNGTDTFSEFYDVNHQVEYIYKRPKVHWWQTDELIILRIDAHDNVQYGLEVTSDSLIYGTKDGNDEPIVAVINFFGSVEFETTKHEVRGLNVIVRLYKSCRLMWPRLQFASDKCSWIIQNMELFTEDREIDYDDQNPSPIDQDQADDDSDDDNEYKAAPLYNYDNSSDDEFSSAEISN